MIIAWVLSLLMFISAVLVHLERLVTLEVIGVHSLLQSQQQLIAAESALFECEKNLSQMIEIDNRTCHIQSAGQNLWLLSSVGRPSLEVLILLDEKTHKTTRLNWRQHVESP